jgi:hypothetical protein
MSDGGIGADHGNVTYWATINITGDLSQAQLQAVVIRLKEIMGQNVTDDGTIGPDGTPIRGRVVQAARVSEGKAEKSGSPVTAMTFNLEAIKKT